MSLQDNRYNSNMEPNSMNNSMEDLRQQLKGSELNNMKLSLENQALQEVERELKSKLKKMDRMLIMKENDDRERDELIHTFQSENTALVDKNGELMDKLRTAQNLIHNNCTGNLTVTDLSKLWTSNSENVICSERIKELESLVETSDLKVHTLEVQLRREQVEKDTCLQKIKELNSLVEATEKKWLNVQEDLQNNVELRAKLSTAQTQIHDGQTACYRKVDFIEGLVLRYSVCSKRTKELESLVEATEKKWLNVQEDLRKIIKELESLVETSDLKVNTLEDQLRSEQVEKETCLQRTKELESLVEATEKKWLNVQEDSQHKVQKMEEDIKFLIVKSIKLQELALMSDSDKARRSEEARQIQKKQKIEKVQREMKLKERDKQEKKKQQKIAKELIEKMRRRKSMGR
ncbi:unnamed protein product [Pleuronectes platessa]|uniref:Uncharacterized protein n=1 Tax=Pleuronectes platessa TaxID=8262 RepID=A0A9N7TZ62_PLEPL|nr:unnamed protein product [Pleuronectes platessa]